MCYHVLILYFPVTYSISADVKTVLGEKMKRNPSKSRLIKFMVHGSQGHRNRPYRPDLGLESIFQTNKVVEATRIVRIRLTILKAWSEKKVKCFEISYHGNGQAIVSKSIMAIASKTIFVGVLMFF